MAGGRRVRPITIAALLLVLGGGTVQAVREWRDLWAEGHVALSVTEVVRLHGDRSVVVLQNRSHARRLPIPVTAQEGTAIERRLHPGAPHSLVARAIDALGSHIVRVAIDVDPAGGLNGTVVVARGLFGSRELPVETGEAMYTIPSISSALTRAGRGSADRDLARSAGGRRRLRGGGAHAGARFRARPGARSGLHAGPHFLTHRLSHFDARTHAFLRGRLPSGPTLSRAGLLRAFATRPRLGA